MSLQVFQGLELVGIGAQWFFRGGVRGFGWGFPCEVRSYDCCWYYQHTLAKTVVKTFLPGFGRLTLRSFRSATLLLTVIELASRSHRRSLLGVTLQPEPEAVNSECCQTPVDCQHIPELLQTQVGVFQVRFLRSCQGHQQHSLYRIWTQR